MPSDAVRCDSSAPNGIPGDAGGPMGSHRSDRDRPLLSPEHTEVLENLLNLR